MDPRNTLERYIKKVGGYEAAAAILGCAEITLRSVINGWRGVGKTMAEMWEEASGGQLLAKNMVWIKATKEAPAKAAKRKPRKARARGRK